MRSGGTMNSGAPMASESAMSQHSPWHSPVPYLFGGLAAMLGLIAFALLILSCSYWKLSGYLENGDDTERDPENGDEKGNDEIKVPSVFEEKIVVIMAGDKKPSFIATPISSRASSFGDNNKKNNCDAEKSDKNKTPKEEMGHQEHQHQQQHQEVAEENRETNQSLNHETQNQNQNQ
ncbi:protein GLUTAMINE DUMPER 2-like [Macadamia integrifolia]|uniref:protein GLUTAMINE DUMPER 2-like n=1 Tax=Macadamia integrifolia TaxID=60698 RepID=UPI001C4F8510|nr:protein GLUTAMINE DUMPER 2-like [Macadamia integrifolia]